MSNKTIITFDAIYGEKEYPIIITKEEFITIEILDTEPNTDNKYSFLPKEGSTDFKGYKNLFYNNKNLACLTIRISTSYQKIFMTKEYISFNAWETGTLILSANLDPDCYNIYEPKGSLIIRISGGLQMEEVLIDKKTGYNITQIFSNYNKDINCIEIQILRYINKARINFKKYFIDFLVLNYDNDYKLKNTSL